MTEVKPHTGQRERRSPTRTTDASRLHLAEAAIQIAKTDTNEFARGYSEIDMIDRIAATQGKTIADRLQLTKEYFAMKQIADSFDDLTGVYDRGTVKRKIQNILDVPPHNGKDHIYVAMDINKLKDLNEKSKRKHLSADEALIAISHFHMTKLVERFGYTAFIGRLSGDEFSLMIPNSTTREVELFFNDIEEERRRAMQKIVEQEELPHDITAMKAIVTSIPGETFNELHERADQELIKQKEERNIQNNNKTAAS